jgi:hypothetical protein
MQAVMDAGLGIWIALVLAGMFSLPLLMRRAPAPPAELAARALLIFSVAVPIAAAAHLFNWATALLLCGASMLATGHAAGRGGWSRALAKADAGRWARAARWSARRALLDRRVRTTASLALVSAAVPAAEAVLNTRLASADEYSLLASTHRLLLGEWPGVLAPAPSLVAMVSSVSAADPLHVVRFLKPVLHLACTLSIATLVRRATGQRHLAWLAAAAAGVALVGVHSSIDLLAVATLFAGLAILQRARRRQTSVLGACGVLAMSVFAAPPLGVFAAVASTVIVGAPLGYAPEGVGMVVLLAALVEPHLFESAASLAPCLVAVGTGLACRQLVRQPLRLAALALRAVPWSRAALAAPALLVVALPHGMRAEYVEPDSAARQALALKQSHVGGRWALVGAQELRIQIGPAIPVIDLQDFVSRYGASAGAAHFRFDLPADRVYVFVEKRSMLAPRTGLSRRDAELNRAVYRIPRLRSDLQRAALELCEAYRRSHAGVSVHYEDEDLRIYSLVL